MGPATRHRATIDRLVKDKRGRWLATLVFDDGSQLVLPRDLLPPQSSKNQVVVISFEIDAEETDRRQAEIRALQDELFNS